MPLKGTPSGDRPSSAPAPPQQVATPDPAFAAILEIWAARGGERLFPVEGDSMRPILDGVDRVRARLGPGPVRRGDIVLFHREGRLIVHRVVGRSRRGLRTRGDGSRGFDPELLSEGKVLGVATELLGTGRPIDLEGAGAGVLRPFLAALSAAAGWIGLDPAGPAPGSRRLARWRDALLVPPYCALLRWSFRAYVGGARLRARLGNLFPDAAIRFLVGHLAAGPTRRSAPAPADSAGWRRAAMRAAQLGVGPLFLHRLRERGEAEAAPPEVLRDLERTHYAQSLYNTRALADLARVVGAFRAAGLRPVVLKGAALAASRYPQIAHRAISDLDLLLPVDEIDRADRLLRGLGYRQTCPPGWEKFYAEHHHGAPYLPPRGHPRLEIHVGLLDRRRRQQPDLERMLERAVELPCGATSAWALAPEDQLIHAALHLAVSGRFLRGMKDLADIDLLLRSPESLDLGRILAGAGRPGIGRALHYALALANDLFGTPLDPRLAAALRTYRLPFLEDRALRRLARTSVSAVPDTGEAIGLATSQWLVSVWLAEDRFGPRCRRLLARALGRERDDLSPRTA
jgi:hypothetical protein